MKNEYGIQLDKNGYAPSIMQDDMTHCYMCGACDQKLDRHEVFFGPYRTKSKRLGLWVTLCHDRCHFGKVHKLYQAQRELKIKCQLAAMRYYTWTVDDFRKQFGKNYI